VQCTTTSGFAALSVRARSVCTEREDGCAANHVRKVLSGLQRIDIDGRDDRESCTAGNLGGDGRANRSKTTCATRIFGIRAEIIREGWC
jgi:hypothetical protein